MKNHFLAERLLPACCRFGGSNLHDEKNGGVDLDENLAMSVTIVG
jgi:hypothetical protein